MDKAAISCYYEQQIFELNHAGKKKLQTNYSQAQKPAELVVSTEAEYKLSTAQKTVKNLTLRIEESSSKTRAHIQDLEKLNMPQTMLKECTSEKSKYENVLKELESAKQEFNKLKLDIASVSDEKRTADEKINSSTSKTLTYSTSLEALTKEIDEINEEHVLVELARIEAIKEYREIEDQRRENAKIYSTKIEESRKKKHSMIREIEGAKEVERKLAITVSDINMLQSKLKQVEKNDNGLERNDIESHFQKEELEATNKALNSVKLESFEILASMDILRDELRHIIDEKAKFKKKEENANMTIKNLNSKLTRAKAKLEATSIKAKSVLSNLSLKLDQIKSETESHQKERSIITEEIAITNSEAQKTESEINLANEKLEATLRDLIEAKSSEATAMENLKVTSENTMRNRALSCQRGSMITITKFEYEYLKGKGDGANEIADKKIAAAQAWIEALKASEKEIMIKTKLLQLETLLNDNVLSTEGMNRSAKSTPDRRAKVRNSTSFTIRRKKKEIAKSS